MLVQEKVDLGNNKFKYAFTADNCFDAGEKLYILKGDKGRTLAQNRLFWAAMKALYRSGAYSFLTIHENPNYPMSFRQFAESVKAEFGKGAKYYIWKAKDGYRGVSDEIPKGDFEYIEAVQESTTNYTKEEFSSLLDNVKAWIRNMGDIPDEIFKMFNMIDNC